MRESSRVVREYRRLAINMNMPPVDENLYVRVMRNRDIPYDTRCSTFDNQNNKTKKPDIPPRCSSLTTNCKLATANLSAQMSNDRNGFLTSDQTFRWKSLPTPLIGPKQINWTSDQVDIAQSKWEILTDDLTGLW